MKSAIYAGGGGEGWRLRPASQGCRALLVDSPDPLDIEFGEAVDDVGGKAGDEQTVTYLFRSGPPLQW